MLKLAQYIATFIFFITQIISGNAQETIMVGSFDKAIISPHIQVVFEEGTQESVTIETASVSKDKINVKIEGKTLRIYLDGAKMVTQSKKEYNEKGWKTKTSIYKGTQVIAKVTYKNLKELSIRGEEVILCKSPINQEDFDFKIYGEPKITVNSVNVKKLDVVMYGEGYLELKEGAVENQKYKVYGEGEVNTLGIANRKTKITAYGESNFRVNVSHNLSITAFGETTVAYSGDPSIYKGLILGDAQITKMKLD